MAEWSPRQIAHDAKGPIYCKEPSDVPHHHFNVAVVHAPKETPADHHASYQALLKKANQVESVNFDAARTMRRIAVLHGKLRKVPEVDRHTDRDLKRVVKKIMRHVSQSCMRWSNVTVSYPLQQLESPEEVGKILATRFNCRLNPTEMAALYAQLDWRKCHDATVGELLAFVAEIIDVDRKVGKSTGGGARPGSPSRRPGSPERLRSVGGATRRRDTRFETEKESGQTDDKAVDDSDEDAESVDSSDSTALAKAAKRPNAGEDIRPSTPVKDLLETEGARDPNDVGSTVYFQADVRVHNIVKDATDGGHIRTAITKIVAAAAAYERKFDGPHLLLGYKGTEITPEVFHATLLRIMHIELTPQEKVDLDQYYSLHHVVHWHHIMGTSAAKGETDVHARLPVHKIDWHFFVKDFMAWCCSSTDWYKEDKRRRSSKDSSNQLPELDALGAPKVERFASTVASQHENGIPSIDDVLKKTKSPKAKTKSDVPVGAAGLLQRRKKHEKLGQKHLIVLQRAIIQARLLRDKKYESRLMVQLFNATEMMVIPQDIKDELVEAMQKRLQDEEKVMIQALATTDIRMWGMDAKLRMMKSSTNEDNARLAASTLARGSQRKSRAAFEKELLDEETKAEESRAEEIAELQRLRVVGDGIMRIAQYRIFYNAPSDRRATMTDKRNAVQNLTKWRNLGKQYRKDILVKIAAVKFKHMGQRRRARELSNVRRLTNAALLIQNTAREFLTRKRVARAKVKQREMDRDLCATRIQHCYRRYRTYQIKMYNKRKMASEAGRRSHLKHSLTVDLSSSQSRSFFVTHVLKLQSKCRGYLARKKVDVMRTTRVARCATKIQMRIRTIRLNRKVRAREKRRRMSTLIQNIVRKSHAKRHLKRLQNKQLKLFRICVEFAEKLATPDGKTVCDAYAVLTIITKGIHTGKELVIETTTPVVHHSESPEWECDFSNRRFGLNDEAVVLLTIFDDQPYRDPVCLGQIRLDASDSARYNRGFLDEVRNEDEVYQQTLQLKKPDLRFQVKNVHKQDPSSRKLTITGSVAVSIEQEPALESQCGWLQRRINRMTEVFVWKPCWAVLHDNLFVIYDGRDEESTKKGPLQVINLAEVSGVSYNERNECFELITFGVGRHFFKCPDAVSFQVRRSWIRKIRRLSAQIPNNEFVSEEVTDDKYLAATKRLNRCLESSGVHVRALEPAPPHVLAMRAAVASLSPKKNGPRGKRGPIRDSPSHRTQAMPPAGSPGEVIVNPKGKDTVEVLKYAFGYDGMVTLNRKLRKSISHRGGYRYRYPVDEEGNASGHVSMPIESHELMVIETQRRSKLTRESQELHNHVDLLHEYLSYNKSNRPYFISTLSDESQTVVHNLYEHLARLHASFEKLASEEKNRRMKGLFPSERKSLVLYQVMVAETFTMPATSMITPMGGRRNRNGYLKPLNSEPTMKGGSNGDRGDVAAQGALHTFSTGKMVTTPTSLLGGQKLIDSPIGREMEHDDLALDSLDMEQTSFDDASDNSSASPRKEGRGFGIRRTHTMAVPVRASL